MTQGSVVVALALVGSAACGAPAQRLADAERTPPWPYAVELVSFDPGDGAGYGADALPDVVLGPPHGGTSGQGSTDVVSLGDGGSIVLKLGMAVTDGPGVDLLVFENPFLFPGGVYAEPGEVSVSADGERWATFPCAPSAPAPNGCAGEAPVYANEDGLVDATDPTVAGGDGFDLEALGDAAPVEAWFVRVVDRAQNRAPPTAGFDLDAISVVVRDAARED